MTQEPAGRLALYAAWRLLPFTVRASSVISAAFILITLAHVLGFSSAQERRASFEKIRIDSESAELGVFDPSVAFITDKQAWMAYTAVGYGSKQGEPLAEIHLAETQTAGQFWQAAGNPVFTSRSAETLYAADGMTPRAQGIVRYESPGLLHDPQDKGREWKIFAYRYFWNGDKALSRETSVIALKYASTPAGPWSQEIWLFGAGAKAPPPPYDRLVLLPLSRLHTSLAGVTGYSDPAPFIYKGRIYLLLTAFTGKDAPTRLILIASNDHGNSWYYAGTLLDAAALKDKAVTRVSGGSFVQKADKIFLMAGFGDDIMQSRDIRLFEIADLARAKLKTNPKTAQPVEAARILPPQGSLLTGLGFGFAAGDDRLTNGFMVSHMKPPGNGSVFNILSSGGNPLKKD